MDVKSEARTRFFSRGEFVDSKGVECSIQESSAAMLGSGDCGPFIWIGCDKIDLQEFTPGQGWKPRPEFDEPDNFPHGKSYIGNTRMHLSQEQVKELLPILQHFAEHGSIYGFEPGETPFLDGTVDFDALYEDEEDDV